MAFLSTIPGIETLLHRKVVVERKSFEIISRELQEAYPHITRGLASRSVRRFCSERGIHATSRLTDADLDRVVATSVSKVGPSYGRKMMTGYLSSQGFRCGERRIGTSLARVAPTFHFQRVSTTHRQTNPIPYTALYFGEKVHIDQNEKLVMFGVTHVCAVDGYSAKIVGFVSMPRKNNSLIYEHLYRKMTLEYGIWDQIRVDHGKEWYLMLFINQTFSHLRGSTCKRPSLQTSSTKNHRVERLWVEVNKRANYPVKAALVEMLENNEISLDDSASQFCISWFSLQVLNVAIAAFITSWNAHPVPGSRRRGIARGVPDRLMQQDNRTIVLPPSLLPNTEEANRMYRASGGRLTDPSPFGSDPLEHLGDRRRLREQAFSERYPSFKDIFHHLVNGDSTPFKHALLFLIDVTRRLSAS